LNPDSVVFHVRRTLDRRANNVLSALTADEQMADIGRAKDPVKISARGHSKMN
jgi:hypothetical protein